MIWVLIKSLTAEIPVINIGLEFHRVGDEIKSFAEAGPVRPEKVFRNQSELKLSWLLRIRQDRSDLKM